MHDRPSSASSGTSREGRLIHVRGTVQGVGFRPWVWRLSHELGIGGSVRNDASGVTIEAFGEPDALDRLLGELRASPPPQARIADLDWRRIAPREVADFSIDASESSTERRVSIPPDLATCPACLAELFDPDDPRHRYPFINCTDCGPRYSIAEDVPYDRPSTTMAGFTLCDACAREYRAPGDRRFHAQPNACPRCGPRLRVLAPATAEPGGAPASAIVLADGEAALERTARALLDGQVVAIKGIGGYHLACDATSEAAVARLRRRKARDAKPLAVMVRDLAMARRVAATRPAEETLLSSVERPIVLVELDPLEPAAERLAPRVAPGLDLVGLMLPYTPLHHLLLAAVDRPLVMTSGNLAGEPIAWRDDDALARLGPITDLVLTHDRPIAAPADDSVARVIAGKPVVLRRGRGFVPRPVGVARPFARPVLAVGAHLKNACCVGLGDGAWLGPHVGDLDEVAALGAFEEAIARMLRLLRTQPEVIAYDMHPGYHATAWAEAWAKEHPRVTRVAVQHHHAHVAATMAEHGLAGPVLGVAFDGTGLGDDGALWGGEFLLATLSHFERVATLRPVPLPGGEQAIKQVWRVGLALADDAFGGDAPLSSLPLFDGMPARRIATVRRMIESRLNAPASHGAGRYFDGLGALGLGIADARYEGEVALRWNLAADPYERGEYPYTIDSAAEPHRLDLRPLVRSAVIEILEGQDVGVIAARCHNGLAAGIATMIRRLLLERGKLPVVLSGGVFQNALLVERLLERLDGLDVHLAREVPPGDGGIALGQAVIADALARGR